jgi:hypothetical protein
VPQADRCSIALQDHESFSLFMLMRGSHDTALTAFLWVHSPISPAEKNNNNNSKKKREWEALQLTILVLISCAPLEGLLVFNGVGRLIECEQLQHN